LRAEAIVTDDPLDGFNEDDDDDDFADFSDGDA
jgi:hypothetical protein